jgi:hypothetical protein
MEPLLDREESEDAFLGRTTLLKALKRLPAFIDLDLAGRINEALELFGVIRLWLGFAGIALSGRTRECFDNGRSEGVRCRSRQPLRMLLGPPLEYEQILPDSDIARTRLDRHWRKPVKSAHLERAVEISRQIGST